MIRPERCEINRYLGYRSITPDDTVNSLIDECISEAEKVIRPAYAVKYLDVCAVDEDILKIGGLVVHSHGLYRNMEHCQTTAMFAATIGHGVDMLIRRAEIGSLLKASVLQAVGAAYVEALCDEVNEDIKRKAEEKGCSCAARFSPGYGDLSLELQKDFERILSMRQQLGITLTDSLLMVPSKSVTAFVGIRKGKCSTAETAVNKCKDCDLYRDCSYSKEVRQ